MKTSLNLQELMNYKLSRSYLERDKAARSLPIELAYNLLRADKSSVVRSTVAKRLPSMDKRHVTFLFDESLRVRNASFYSKVATENFFNLKTEASEDLSKLVLKYDLSPIYWPTLLAKRSPLLNEAITAKVENDKFMINFLLTN